jgi:hypothetical protein
MVCASRSMLVTKFGYHLQPDKKRVKIQYSLRSILLFTNMDVSTTKMCLDTFVLAKSNMGRREYMT